jgi:hypothetical protein
MNYIAKLRADLDAAHEQTATARDGLEELLVYLTGDKFQGAGNDHVHLRTDLLPKLMQLRGVLLDR